MSDDTALADNAELEDLFDSIAFSPAPAASVPASPLDASACGHAECSDRGAGAANKMLNCVGQLTRQLHDTLAELGYDRQIQECAAAQLPDARQRLAYVVTLTEQAASRSLAAVELATPLQERMAADAASLAGRWDTLFRGESDVPQFKALAKATRDYLGEIPAQTASTREHLREIVIAQEFQDLTGQVLKRITELASDLETQLLRLLVQNAPVSVRHTEAFSLLNGPAINASSEVVANQAQVDELLESLGF